jgi:hypothetical protein
MHARCEVVKKCQVMRMMKWVPFEPCDDGSETLGEIETGGIVPC